MKAYEIAKAFADIFAGAQVVTGAVYLIEQSGGQFALPALIFEATVKPMNDKGSALTYTLTIWIEGTADRAADSDPDPALAQAARVELVRDVVNGTQKNDLLDALNAGGAYGFDFRNWSALESDPGIEASHFRTPIAIAGIALVL